MPGAEARAARAPARRVPWCAGVVLALAAALAGPARAQEPPHELTAPVNDFAGVIDAGSARDLDALIRSLQQASGDVVVVATVETIAPYGDIREYAVRMFENRGRGIGERGRDNGLLILLAVQDRQVHVEVGYGLEEFITDGFAGETSRLYMVPEFRQGQYGSGLLAGTRRIVQRIADRRNATLEGVSAPRRVSRDRAAGPSLLVFLFVLFLILNAVAGRMHRRRWRRHRRWGGPPWSGWHSGVGPFGGGFGGFGRGGGGFGGGFGGFGGGRSGGGGGGASW